MKVKKDALVPFKKIKSYSAVIVKKNSFGRIFKAWTIL